VRMRPLRLGFGATFLVSALLVSLAARTAETQPASTNSSSAAGQVVADELQDKIEAEVKTQLDGLESRLWVVKSLNLLILAFAVVALWTSWRLHQNAQKLVEQTDASRRERDERIVVLETDLVRARRDLVSLGERVAKLERSDVKPGEPSPATPEVPPHKSDKGPGILPESWEPRGSKAPPNFEPAAIDELAGTRKLPLGPAPPHPLSPGQSLTKSPLEDFLEAIPRLADRFRARASGERFASEMGSFLRLRQEQLALPNRTPSETQQHWIATLDQLGQWLSRARQEEEQAGDRDYGLSRELADWLYRRLGSHVREQGWFELEPVLPYETPFDARRHHAQGSRPALGAEGRVLELRSVGRWRLGRSELQHEANVIVGA
jgi:hypothetical protein